MYDISIEKNRLIFKNTSGCTFTYIRKPEEHASNWPQLNQ